MTTQQGFAKLLLSLRSKQTSSAFAAMLRFCLIASAETTLFAISCPQRCLRDTVWNSNLRQAALVAQPRKSLFRVITPLKRAAAFFDCRRGALLPYRLGCRRFSQRMITAASSAGHGAKHDRHPHQSSPPSAQATQNKSAKLSVSTDSPRSSLELKPDAATLVPSTCQLSGSAGQQSLDRSGNLKNKI